jgi:hypothetical protein
MLFCDVKQQKQINDMIHEAANLVGVDSDEYIICSVDDFTFKAARNKQIFFLNVCRDLLYIPNRHCNFYSQEFYDLFHVRIVFPNQVNLEKCELVFPDKKSVCRDKLSWLEPGEHEFLKMKWFDAYAKLLLDFASIHLKPENEIHRISEQVDNLQKQINELKSMMKNKADEPL